MKNYQKAVILLLALIMVFFCMACGDNSSNAKSSGNAGAAAESGKAKDNAPITLTVVNGYGLSDVGSKTLSAFCDYVEENTGGTIKFERYFGGTMCSLPEEFALVSSGAVDVITLLQDFVIADMPLCNIPGSTIDDQMGGINYWRYIMFENEQTSKLIEAEAAAQNVVFLDVQSGGIGAYVCRRAFSSWADLGAYKFGALRNSNIYEGLGLSCVAADPNDVYDSLSRGVYDSSGMGIGSVISQKWYEVAPYCLACKGFSGANYMTVNLDTWNSLTAEQQQAEALGGSMIRIPRPITSCSLMQ